MVADPDKVVGRPRVLRQRGRRALGEARRGDDRVRRPRAGAHRDHRRGGCASTARSSGHEDVPRLLRHLRRFDMVREYLDGFDNLFLVGRNGMHRYNNQDHSMLTAMERSTTSPRAGSTRATSGMSTPKTSTTSPSEATVPGDRRLTRRHRMLRCRPWFVVWLGAVFVAGVLLRALVGPVIRWTSSYDDENQMRAANAMLHGLWMGEWGSPARPFDHAVQRAGLPDVPRRAQPSGTQPACGRLPAVPLRGAAAGAGTPRPDRRAVGWCIVRAPGLLPGHHVDLVLETVPGPARRRVGPAGGRCRHGVGNVVAPRRKRGLENLAAGRAPNPECLPAPWAGCP